MMPPRASRAVAAALAGILACTSSACFHVRAEAPPFPGANSFTESQARSRIEGEGFSAVSELRKDDQGIWRGTAMKDGKNVSVALDYKGNVVAQ